MKDILEATTGAVSVPEKLQILKKYVANNIDVGDGLRVLDIGGTNVYHDVLRAIFPGCQVFLFNIDSQDLRGVDNAILGDAEKLCDYLSGETFNVVLSMDLIEHLTDPDAFLSGVHSVLVPGGYFFITTPNLADFCSRLIFSFGYMPYQYSPSNRYRVAVPFRKTDTEQSAPSPHRVLFTYKALKELLSIYGFEIFYESGFTYTNTKNFENKLRRLLGRLLPNGLKEGIFLACRK